MSFTGYVPVEPSMRSRRRSGEGFGGVTVQTVKVLVGVIVGVSEHQDVLAGQGDETLC